ncbi:hypothetical protein DESPIG_01872 [Desulfovibrio piger ATCC 29098]|uniref:Uncharacterized protein n=1 Tax=Desulfovibrio piger ATCC 29098 TaxID=411464 RepID=B6WUW1_9BACT|nr:hypothetical protein DESPIG_01872 [Desulfovibrio piger ATCC 29098]
MPVPPGQGNRKRRTGQKFFLPGPPAGLLRLYKACRSRYKGIPTNYITIP